MAGLLRPDLNKLGSGIQMFRAPLLNGVDTVRSSLDRVVARDSIYDECLIIHPPRKMDPLITSVFHRSKYLAAVANSKIVLVELQIGA